MLKEATRVLTSRFALIAALATPVAGSGQQPLSFSDKRWEVGGDSTRMEMFDGRETLRMESGSAKRRDVQLEDGTIDVDLVVTRRRSFVYVNFRMQTDGDYEEFYLRPHKSTLPDAVQYSPVYQGQSAWQLYYGPRGTAAPEIRPNVWQHLRIVLSGRRAAFFLGDTVKPFMVVPHLARDPRAGYLELSAFVPPGTPGSGAAVRYADLVVRPGVVAYSFTNPPPEPTPAPGTIRAWDVGEPFVAPDSALSVISPEWVRTFTNVPIEPDGFAELHRYVKLPPGVKRFVGAVARIRVTAQVAGIRRLDLGFSDRVTVFLNGQPVFYRDDSYDYERRRDGLISLDQAAVYLPLRAGVNDISLIVTDRFGGWAVMGRFPEMRGLTVSPQ
ncbi:MAG: hypothetical protein M3Z18_04200 [Gemmatimonadota bacterium]|nr:hypothetical protein [Gemmatimonadota bacterium]